MHIIKSLLSYLALLSAVLAIPTTLTPRLAANLRGRGDPFLCVPNERFTIGYKVCTFAALISPVNVAHLWLFKADCGVIGEATDVNVFDESPDSIDISATEQTYNFNSQLIEATSVDLKDGKSPVTVQYEGMSWGGKADQCWFNGDEEYICSFEFDC